MLRSFLKPLLALLAAFAVLLGALEHEDLILQEAPTVIAHADSESFTVADGDAGTEGTFRFHLPRLWLSPPATGRKPLRVVPSAHAPLAPVVQDRRLALAGHIALRL